MVKSQGGRAKEERKGFELERPSLEGHPWDSPGLGVQGKVK